MIVKIVGIHGSPRPQGNSTVLVDAVLEGAKEKGTEVQSFNLNALNIKGCQACGACHKNKDIFCVQKDDMERIYEAIADADAVIIGSPIYMAQMSAQTMLFLNRLYAFMYTTQDGKSHFKIGPKRVVTVYSQGAPMAGHYVPYFDMSDASFGMMLQGKVESRIVCANAYTDELIADAREAGKKLAE